MLRINLLQLPEPESGAPEPAGYSSKPGAGKRALALLILLLVAGGAGWYLMRESARAQAVAAAAAADSAHAALDASASRSIAAGQALCAGVLADLQNAPAAGIGFSRIVLTAPGSFSLAGRAESMETLAPFQESLLLLPGMNLRASQATPVDSAPPAQEFLFAGSVAYPAADSAQPENRVLPEAQWAAAWGAFLDSARAGGIEFDAAESGRASVPGGLQARSYRLRTQCGYAPMLTLLQGLNARRSAIGVRRLSLQNQGDSLAFILDIMAYLR